MSSQMQHLWQQASSFEKKGLLVEALELYKRIFTLKYTDIPFNLIKEKVQLMWKLGCMQEASHFMAPLYKQYPNTIQILYLYAMCKENENRFLAAKKLFEQCHLRLPHDTNILYSLASVLRFLGEKEASHVYYHKILNKNPLATDVLRMLGEEHNYKKNDSLFMQLLHLLPQQSMLSDEKKVDLYFALAKAYDDTAELSKAFEYYDLGSRLHLKGKQSEHIALRHLKDYFIKTLNKSYFSKIANKPMTVLKQKPVFIVGMPRSGTTLTEQIICSLTDVESVGEVPYVSMAIQHMDVAGRKVDSGEVYPFSHTAAPSLVDRRTYYLERLESMVPAAGTERIVDKMPANFQWLGLIYQLFPNASVIHVRRHPVETCLSAYRLHFTHGQYWSYNLKTMGQYYRYYDELMRHWKKTLPADFLMEVKYEEILFDLEGQSQMMAAHIGIPWSSTCLDFYKKESAVCTASFSQVRKPIYLSSLNRWKKYASYLKPLLDEIGDLVEIYEKELKA